MLSKSRLTLIIFIVACVSAIIRKYAPPGPAQAATVTIIAFGGAVVLLKYVIIGMFFHDHMRTLAKQNRTSAKYQWLVALGKTVVYLLLPVLLLTFVLITLFYKG